WSATLLVSPGMNSIRVYCLDTSGNPSATNSVNCKYALTTPITVQIIGPGEVKPNYNAQQLTVGSAYKISAKAVKGCQFKGWTGSLTNASPKISFIMSSN